MIRAAVVGGAGYVGIEIVRHLLAHPDMELSMATSDSEKGRAISEVYPALTGRTDMRFSPMDLEAVASGCDIAFLAVPHTKALELAPALCAAGLKVVDLSADFRIKDAATYEEWYGCEHGSPDLLAEAVYGIPELHRLEMAMLVGSHRPADSPVLVACAGCYPTASLLAVKPMFAKDWVAGDHIIINALSGVSGAGKSPKPNTHFCSADEAVNAYGAATHRHTPEIDQELTLMAGTMADPALGAGIHATFIPHLIPMKRGLLSTVSLQLKPGLDIRLINDAYDEAYHHERFVRFVGNRMPSTAEVCGTNNVHIGVTLDERSNTLIASSAIDNLGKGAASQAIQCANILCGFDEAAGIDMAVPVV